MNKMTNRLKRWLSLLMSVVMIATQLPLPVYAEGRENVWDDAEESITEEKGSIADYAIDTEEYSYYADKTVSITVGDGEAQIIYDASPIVNSIPAEYSYIGVLYAKESDDPEFFPDTPDVSAGEVTEAGLYSFKGMFENLDYDSEVWLEDLSEGTYRFRIVVAIEDGNNHIASYHFLTADPYSFTISEAPDVISSVAVDEWGYGYEKVLLNLTSDDLYEDEEIYYVEIITDEGHYYADLNDDDTAATRIISTSCNTIDARAVIISSNEAKRLSKRVPVERKVRGADTATVDFDVVPGGGSLTFTATLEPSYDVDTIWAYVNIRKKGSAEDWTKNAEPEILMENGSFSYTFYGLEENAVYEWYADVEVAFSNIVLGTDGTEDDPNEVTTLADRDLGPDDFSSAKLYEYLSSNTFLRGNELTKSLLESCDNLQIDRNSHYGIVGLDDISDLPVWFPNLETVVFKNQDITDISPLMSLKKLEYIDVTGNDITTLPENFSEKFRYARVYLANNLIDPEVKDNQDTMELKIDSRQYTSGDKKQLYFTFGHGISEKEYDVYLSVDGGEDQLVEAYRGTTYRYYYDDCSRYFLIPDISAQIGNKKECRVKLTIKQGTKVLSSGSANIFYDDIEVKKIAEGDSHVNVGTVYIPNKYLPETVPNYVNVSIRKDGKVYAEEKNPVNYDSEPLEFECFTNTALTETANRGYYVNPSYDLYWDETYVSSGKLNETLKAGEYDIVISTVGEESEELVTFAKKLKVINGAYISGAVVDRSLDNRGDNIYIYVRGRNVDSEKIRPVIKSIDGSVSYTTTATASYVPDEIGEMSYLFTVKKGTNWGDIQSAPDSKKFLLDFVTEDGYEWIDDRYIDYKTVSAYELKDMVPYDFMFVYYNCRKKALEVFGPAEDFAGKDFSITTNVFIYGDGGKDINETASGSGKFDASGRALVNMKDASGKVYVPSSEHGMASYKIQVNGMDEYSSEFNENHPCQYGAIREMTAAEAKAWACVIGVSKDGEEPEVKDGYLRFYDGSTGPYTVRIYELARQHEGAVKEFSFTEDKFDIKGFYTFTETDLEGLMANEVYSVIVSDSTGHYVQDRGFITTKTENGNNENKEENNNTDNNNNNNETNNPTVDPTPVPAPDAPL
nr:leucine-rich repeat domain-containing protein [Lachnospiraceae bacterium]